MTPPFVDIHTHTAKTSDDLIQIVNRDLEQGVIVMDHNNLCDLKRMFDEDTNHKISLLMDYTPLLGEVADPWYTGNLRPLGWMSWGGAEDCWHT